MSDIDRLRDAWKDAQLAEHVAKMLYHDAMVKAFPLKIGDVIRSSNGAIAKVSRVFVKWDRNVEFAAVMKKKDGTWGEREVPAWRTEWDKPEVIGHEDPTP